MHSCMRCIVWLLFVVLFVVCLFVCVFFFNYTATTEIYTLSLHDALPIWYCFCFLFFGDCASNLEPESCEMSVAQPLFSSGGRAFFPRFGRSLIFLVWFFILDRKSTRLNSSHGYNSYAVFFFKKKKKKTTH